MSADIGAYRLHIIPCALLLGVCQLRTVKDESIRLVFVKTFLMMRFAFCDLKLREHISEAAVKYALDGPRKSSVSVSAYYNHLSCLMYKSAHVLISIVYRTYAGCSVPA